MTYSNRIDVHQHVVPPFWAGELAKHGGDPSGWKSPAWTPELAINFMDDNQIATGILSLTAPSITGWHSKSMIDMARKVNEYTADLVQKMPGRFGNFITLPLPDIDASLSEINYAYEHLDADGVVLMTNYQGIYLGDERFSSVWDELNRRSAVVFIHPAKPPMASIPGIPGPVIDYPMDTTRTAIHMVVEGVMKRCQNINVILSHAGGFLPYASYRFAELLPGLHPTLSKDEMLGEMKKFYFDTALSSSHVALKTLLAFAEPGHILYGSDFPYAPASVSTSFAHQLDNYENYTGDQLREINYLNGLKLFPRLMK